MFETWGHARDLAKWHFNHYFNRSFQLYDGFFVISKSAQLFTEDRDALSSMDFGMQTASVILNGKKTLKGHIRDFEIEIKLTFILTTVQNNLFLNSQGSEGRFLASKNDSWPLSSYCIPN